MKLYKLAPDCARVGAALIERHHSHLAGLPVLFVFINEPEKVKGQTALATARKISAKELPLLVLAVRNGTEDFETMPGFGSCGFSADENGWLEVDSDSGDGFLITVWEKAWGNLTDAQRSALIDHELCHCTVMEDDKGRINTTIVGHDIEEFREVVRRHGHWLPHISEFVESCKAGQERFDFESQTVAVGQ